MMLLYFYKFLTKLKKDNDTRRNITLPRGTEIDLPKSIGCKNKIARKLTAGVCMAMILCGAIIIGQEVMISGKENVCFNITAGNES